MELTPFVYISMIVAGGGAFYLLVGLYYLWRSVGSRSWPTADGAVDTALIESDPRYEVHVIEFGYIYTVNGVKYRNDRLYFGDALSIGEAVLARRVARNYHPGQAVKVYHHPRRPWFAVLEPGIHWRLVAGQIYGLLITAIGVGAYLYCTGEWQPF